MLKKLLLSLLAFIIGGLVVTWFTIGQSLYDTHRATSPTTAPGDYAKQNDSRVPVPVQQTQIQYPFDPLKNVYWGDTHVHTRASFDATLFGTTLTVEDAYRFAKGEAMRNAGGELMQLSRPLDFVAITDHAESFGNLTRCGEANLTLLEKVNCWVFLNPNVAIFRLIRGSALGEGDDVAALGSPGVYQKTARTHPNQADLPICSRGEGGPARCYRDSESEWARYIDLADRYNEPGILTTFAAYEYSPVLPDTGKHHRNVIFNGSDLPGHATSYLDVGSAIELWRGLEATCSGSCDFLTIPHNMNKGWGLFYSRHTWDGKTYEPEDWRLRMRREPLAEMYQVKGASECALGVGATDEECAFSQVFEPCDVGEVTGCAFETGFARQGLKIGLQMEQELGFNPLAFGMVGSTDTHNANPGDTEEWDFVGGAGAVTSPAIRRYRQSEDKRPFKSTLTFHTAGGLAAVWAEENTRDAIFAGMKRREAYATSGPRITLRFFAGWEFDEQIVNDGKPIAIATAGGVPMGGVLYPENGQIESPTFFTWAAADVMSAPLQRVQIIKGWIDAEGNTHESVRDIACADELKVDPTTGRCPNNGASVDISSCQTLGETGARQLMSAWKDPEYDASQGAFYYVRAIQNPTCRWSTYDAIRLGIELDPRVPATIRERAWSSPIWIDP